MSNPNAELIFGTLAFCTTTASLALKYYEYEYFYTFPLYYDYEYAWHTAGVYFESLWITYASIWVFVYFGVNLNEETTNLINTLWEMMLVISPAL